MSCCCTGCEYPPQGYISARGANRLQSFCCQCLPKYACVSMQCDYLSSGSGTTGTGEPKPTVLVPIYCEAQGTGATDYPIMYSVDFPFQGSTVDLQFCLRLSGGKCYFVLTSTALSLTGETGDGYEVNQTLREGPIYFCKNLWVAENTPASWLVETELCDQGAVTIEIAGVKNLPIVNRHANCLDENGDAVMDESPLRNRCKCCDCICKCACITVFGDNRSATTEYVCATVSTDTGTGTAGQVERLPCKGQTQGDIYWEGNGARIDLVEYDGVDDRRCALDLVTLPVAQSGTGGLAKQLISGAFGTTDCQNVEALWSYFDTSGNAVFVQFLCAPCQECQTVEGCCQELVPRILTASISRTDTGTGSDLCSCTDFTMQLVWDDQLSAWIGDRSDATETLFCGHGVKLTLSCGAATTGTGSTAVREWNLIVEADPCIFGAGGVTDVGSCSPLMLSFDVTSSGGIGCCGPSDTGVSTTWTIEITE